VRTTPWVIATVVVAWVSTRTGPDPGPPATASAAPRVTVAADRSAP
jgi:hypothetical protein